MARGRMLVSWLGMAAGVLWATVQPLSAQSLKKDNPGESRSLGRRFETPVPLEQIAAPVRERVRAVMAQPTLTTRGPAEVFVCQPPTYYWLLDHPDRAVQAWQRLGAKCMDITDRGNGRFGWTDRLGSDVAWDTVHSDAKMRVWFAEGKVCPGWLMPSFPVRAVLIMRHDESRDATGRSLMRHQVELFIQTDSKAANFVTRFLGASAPRLAEEYVAQLEMFFSVLAAYLHQHPDQAPALLSQKPPSSPE